MIEDFSYPMMVSLRGSLCVVVGGGAVAARKARSLLSAGAGVRMIAPGLSADAASLAEDAAVEHLCGRYAGSSQIAGARLVVAATGDEQVDSQVARDASAAGIPVNCASIPELSTFIVPASFSEGPITVSVSCSGLPMLSRALRDAIRGWLGARLGDLASDLKSMRAEARALLPSPEARGEFWRGAVSDEVVDMLREGRIDEARERIADALSGIRA